jgi:hypothetical protein
VEDEYRIKLMPRPEATYRALMSKAARLPSDPRAPNFYEIRPYAKMLERVNTIFRSLIDPRDSCLDQPLLESLSYIQTRNVEATLVYFFRLTAERRIGILHITDCDGTTSYARFHAFMQSEGPSVLAQIGVDLPTGSIGSSAMLQ